MKTCKDPSCQEINPQPADNFYKMKASEDGRHYYCKSCCKRRRAHERVVKREKKVNIGYRQRQRAKEEGIECDDTITLAGLYKRDHGICQICHKAVRPKEASIDHIHPISRGGTHTWDNVQLTHVKCNLRKSNKTTPKKHSRK